MYLKHKEVIQIILDEFFGGNRNNTISDIIYNEDDGINIIPTTDIDGSSKYYSFYQNGIINDIPQTLEEDKLINSIINIKIQRMFKRILRMRSHTNQIVTDGYDWYYIVKSSKQYMYKDKLYNRILAIIGQKNGNQYAIIRKL